MAMLILGVAIWIGVHLVPSVAAPVKAGLVERIGAGPYKGLFALSIAVGVVLIIFGWRATIPEIVYIPPIWAPHLTVTLMVLAFILMGAANYPTRIKRFVRHPQLTGVVIWAIGHLIANGDIRSVILFGGLGLWALIEMPLINAREGAWVKPDAPSMVVEIRGIAISLVVFAVIYVLHPYFTGMPIIF